MRHAWTWAILSVLFFQTLCHGTSIVWVVSQTGEYVVLAADSHRSVDILDPKFKSPDPRKTEPNNHECKVIVLGDTLFFDSGSVLIKSYRGKSWDSMQAAREIYTASKDHEAQALSIAWGNRALAWFYGQSQSDIQSVADPDGGLVLGGFINFDSNRNPASFLQTLYFDAGTRKLFGKPRSQAKGQIGLAGVEPELIREFEKAETPRALKAYGTLKIHNVTKDLSYDIQFVQKAIQFVIDNVNAKDRQSVHGPIEVVVIRRLGGIDWVTRKHSCYAMDLGSTKAKASGARH
jgi:hypothetical protein